MNLYRTGEVLVIAPLAADSEGECYDPNDLPQGYFLGDPNNGRVFPRLDCDDPTMQEWCKYVERTAAQAAMHYIHQSRPILPALAPDDPVNNVVTGDASNLAMSQSPCLLVLVGQCNPPRRVIMLCDTGATHNLLSKRVATKLRQYGVPMTPIPKRLERPRSVNDSAFTISEAVQLPITIGNYTYRIDFHVADEVNVDMNVGYPQMRLYNWKMDLSNPALDIRGTRYGFLTQDDFLRLSRARGIYSFHAVPTCARATVVIRPNATAYVVVEFPVDPEGSVVFFEPDPGCIARYQAYPCPGILDAAQPTVICLLNARADKTLQVMPGMVFGQSNLVRRVANGFYLELAPIGLRETTLV